TVRTSGCAMGFGLPGDLQRRPPACARTIDVGTRAPMETGADDHRRGAIPENAPMAAQRQTGAPPESFRPPSLLQRATLYAKYHACRHGRRGLFAQRAPV